MIGLEGPFTNLYFGICAIYFDLKVYNYLANLFRQPRFSWKKRPGISRRNSATFWGRWGRVR